MRSPPRAGAPASTSCSTSPTVTTRCGAAVIERDWYRIDRYRLTPGSLKRAREQGLKTDHLLGILRKHASTPIPPPFLRALQRWEANGVEARVETVTILRVNRPETLEELRNSSAARFLGEILGPTSILIKSGAASKVLAALAEMGLLAEESGAQGVSVDLS